LKHLFFFTINLISKATFLHSKSQSLSKSLKAALHLISLNLSPKFFRINSKLSSKILTPTTSFNYFIVNLKPGKCYLLKHYFHQILQIIYFLLSRPENLFCTFFLLKSNCSQNHLPPPKTTYFTKPISDARHSISFIKASQNFAPSHANALILTLLILYLSLESPALKGQMALIIFTLLFTFNINFEAVIELEEIN
jgi:hypothetical protein